MSKLFYADYICCECGSRFSLLLDDVDEQDEAYTVLARILNDKKQVQVFHTCDGLRGNKCAGAADIQCVRESGSARVKPAGRSATRLNLAEIRDLILYGDIHEYPRTGEFDVKDGDVEAETRVQIWEMIRNTIIKDVTTEESEHNSSVNELAEEWKAIEKSLSAGDPMDEAIRMLRDGAEISIRQARLAKMWDSGYCPSNCPHLASNDSGRVCSTDAYTLCLEEARYEHFACSTDAYTLCLEEARYEHFALRHGVCPLPRPEYRQ